MKASGEDAAAKVAAAGTPPPETTTEVAKKQTLGEWLGSQITTFQGIFPKKLGLDGETFVQSAQLELQTNPKVAACAPRSIVLALRQTARYGLEVGSMLGQAWLIPRKKSWKEQGQWKSIMECKFQLGYKGIMILMRRGGVVDISAEIVYENDFKNGNFRATLGIDRTLVHSPDFFSPRGKPIGYYAIAKLENGETPFVIMSVEDVKAHRDATSEVVEKKKQDKDGKEYKSKDTVWDTNFDSMALKTCIIKVSKFCPLSVDAQRAIAEEEARERGEEVLPAEVARPMGNDFDEDDHTGTIDAEAAAEEVEAVEPEPAAAEPEPEQEAVAEPEPEPAAEPEPEVAETAPEPEASEEAALSMGVPEVVEDEPPPPEVAEEAAAPEPEVSEAPAAEEPAAVEGEKKPEEQPGLGIF